MRPCLLAVPFAVAASLLAPRPARASAVAYPRGEFARLAAERAVLVWDAARSTEHLVRKPSFDGDAQRFGFFVPTPTVPRVAKEDDGIFERVAALLDPHAMLGDDALPHAAAAGGDVEVAQRVQVDDFDLATLRAKSPDALVAWLHANAFADRPGLRAWAEPYLERGWVITAMRYAPPAPPPMAHLDGGTAAHAGHLDTPTLRFSFATPTPYYPYREPPAEPDEQAAFLKRAHLLGVERRPLYVWVVAPGAVEAFDGERLSGPYLHASAEVPASRLAAALGATRDWGFNPSSRPAWTVTYLTQFEDRESAGDLTFAPAKVLATALAPAPAKPRTPSPWPRRRWALAALALAALVAAFTWSELRAARS